MGSIAQYAIDYIYAKVTGGKVIFGNIATYKTHYELTDFGPDDHITRYAMESFVSPGIIPLIISLPANTPSLYTLSAPQLAAVNAFGKWPNFVAVVYDGTVNRYFPDIEPLFAYGETPGNFTAIQVKLHNDGSGVNPDDTVVQFG